MISKITMPKIKCAVCDKLVDKTEIEHKAYDMSVVIRVWCHGETEICKLSSEFLHNLEPVNFKQLEHGVAFTNKKITQEAI
jgi:hypothetical protein